MRMNSQNFSVLSVQVMVVIKKEVNALCCKFSLNMVENPSINNQSSKPSVWYILTECQLSVINPMWDTEPFKSRWSKRFQFDGTSCSNCFISSGSTLNIQHWCNIFFDVLFLDMACIFRISVSVFEVPQHSFYYVHQSGTRCTVCTVHKFRILMHWYLIFSHHFLNSQFPFLPGV